MATLNQTRVVELLNRILEVELAGVVRYTHYSLLVYGYGRIPIVSWLRAQADESLLDSHRFDVGDILRESLEAERLSLSIYRELLAEVEGRSVSLEEYARQMIAAEEQHAADVIKMLRKPGDQNGCLVLDPANP